MSWRVRSSRSELYIFFERICSCLYQIEAINEAITLMQCSSKYRMTTSKGQPFMRNFNRLLLMNCSANVQETLLILRWRLSKIVKLMFRWNQRWPLFINNSHYYKIPLSRTARRIFTNLGRNYRYRSCSNGDTGIKNGRDPWGQMVVKCYLFLNEYGQVTYQIRFGRNARCIMPFPWW